MFSSERNPRASFKPDGEFLKGDSNFYQSHNLSHESSQLQLQQQVNGLARYPSAPSAVFATLLNPDNDNGSSSGDDESEAMFTTFVNGSPIDLNQKNGVHQYAMKQEVGLESNHRPRQSNGFSIGQMGSDGRSYSVRGGNGNSSNNLIRQSSSPAGFYGINITGELGNYKVSEASSSASGMNNQINFSSGPSLTSRFMPSIPEAVNENISARSAGNGSGFAHDSWNETSFNNNLKRNNDGELKMFSTFNGLENQNGETRKNSSGLVHQLSLPNTPSEMADIEKYLQFQQEVVPCQIRAKRGCATHPRSIAERNRRTRIANKMKKLQDLFPNMDKQANQADMLEWAVDQIKDLQKQVQTLKDVHEKCICPGKSQ